MALITERDEFLTLKPQRAAGDRAAKNLQNGGVEPGGDWHSLHTTVR